MKLKSYALVLSLLIALFLSVQIIASSKSASALADEPPVVMAVAPNYPALIDPRSGAKGDVLVQVKVEADGSVSSAKAISGHPVLHPSSEEAAKRWRFVPSSGASSQRNMILTFTFTPMPKQTPISELTTIFHPPYKIEVRKIEEILTVRAA